MQYLQHVFSEISNNVSNHYSDNWDSYRFGKEPKRKISFKQKIISLLNSKNYYNLQTLNTIINSSEVTKFEYLYNQLEREEDRELLIKVLAYRLLGYLKVKLPLNTPEYWTTLKNLEKLRIGNENIKPGFLDVTLYKLNLEKISFPIQLYFSELGIMVDYIIKQYEYNKNGKVIKAEKGDVVLDAGGCWGDTALFFANEVGSQGKVYTFEFIPKNLEIMKTNFSLNPELEQRVEIVNKPIWKDSNTKIFYVDYGPASQVSLEPITGMDGECNTLAIDNFLKENNIAKVDFIKMDIEGAETIALQGALETIRKFKPKLAITLYHSVEDFERIPKLIKEAVPEYKFYFSHCTIYHEESVLFAEV